MSLWKTAKDSLLHLLYPTTCLHCCEQIPPDALTLCKNCATLLECIDPDERCSTCFGQRLSEHLNHCPYCVRHPSLYYSMGAAFDYEGPAATMVKKLKYSNQPQLARGMAAFMLAQLCALDWPLPDAFVPVPLSLSHYFDRGYNQSALLAEEMSKLSKIPVWDVLKRRSGDYSQAGLTLEQRRQLGHCSFKLKKRHPIEGKTLLIIDDVLTSGATLRKCGEVLMEANPGCLYALTFCKA